MPVPVCGAGAALFVIIGLKYEPTPKEALLQHLLTDAVIPLGDPVA
jgi:hypothetical protein